MSWMEVNFKKQNPCIPSWPGVFWFGMFSSIALTDSRCMSTSVSLLQSFCFLRGFHISVSWWSFARVWVTASLLKSPGLFSVFWPICSLDGHHTSTYFQILQSLYQSFGDCIESTNYYWHNRHFHVPQFFQFPSKVEVLILLFAFFQFYFVIRWDSRVHNSANPLLLLISFIIILIWDFFTSALADVFHWSLGDSKSPQVSRTLLYSGRSQQCCSLYGLHSSS